MNKLTVVLILAGTIGALGQSKKKPEPGPAYNIIQHDNIFTLSTSTCESGFLYDANTKTCYITIGFMTPAPVTCTPLDAKSQTMKCSYKPEPSK